MIGYNSSSYLGHSDQLDLEDGECESDDEDILQRDFVFKKMRLTEQLLFRQHCIYCM